jgi:hypothetical protein
MEITSAKLPKRSWAKICQVRTLSIERIVDGLNEIIAG